MKLSDIRTPVSSITGIGPQLTKTLSKVNIFTVADLLQYYPRTYEDQTKRLYLKDFATTPSHKVHTVAQILRQEWFGYGNMKTLKLIITDGTANAELICFNRGFLEKTTQPGTIVTVTGAFFVKYNSLQSTAFEITVHKFEQLPPPPLAQITPQNSKVISVYPLTAGLTQKNLQKAIHSALSQYAHGIDDELPQSLIEDRNLLHKIDALRMIHEPATLEQAQLAHNTLTYEEFFHFQEIILERAYKHRGSFDALEHVSSPQTDSSLPIAQTHEEFRASLSPLQQQFLDSLPYALTDDQKKIIQELNADIDKGYTERSRIQNQLDRGMPSPVKTPFTMARLLQGDVGSGKTLVSLFACLRIINWKGQCAFMAPTEILARQHADTTIKMLGFLGVRVAFLTGNVKAVGRNQIIKALKNGEIDIIVGTHALFSAQVVYKDLELAVIDEQHRFGVMQRQAIIAKGRVNDRGATFEPHLLMMSATPIPQTLALTIFGDLDVSTIKTLPAGRKPITTYLVKEGNENNAYQAVRKELEKGHQAYFVYPAIDSDQNFKSAQRAFENLKENIYADFNCALIHGKVLEEEQSHILQEFRDGNIQVLAATTVIEVGVDVPNATCMVIEQADRFGMAQLHQLRGRVGRGSELSFCFLVYSQNITNTGIERMKTLRQSTDGFYIAEQDLKTRGPGEINGTLQAGALGFKIGDISQDHNLMLQARSDALFRLRRLQDGERG